MAAALLALALSGCSLHHAKARPLVLPPFQPVELAAIPRPEDTPIIESDDEDEDLPPVPVAEGATAPKRQRRHPVKPVVSSGAAGDTATTPPAPPAAQQVAAATPGSEAAASVIGELTPGGDLDPKAQQEAAELIAANEKRIGALPSETQHTQAALVSNVRNFQRQAQQALKGGDAGGAKTLATKAKLLLDDLEKGAGT